MANLCNEIAAFVRGDLTRADGLSEVERAALDEAATHCPPIVVAIADLRAVASLSDLANPDRQREARLWGFVLTERSFPQQAAEGPTFSVEFDEKEHDLIAEFVGRMRELGDEHEGWLTGSEVQEWRRRLASIVQ